MATSPMFLKVIKLIGRKFVVKTFHGFDPITGSTDFIGYGIKD